MTTDTPGVPSSRHAQAKTSTPAWITCVRCDTRWTGLNTCHCGKCHRTFTGISAFDEHRRNSVCLDPATLPRLALVTKPHWSGWGYPSEDARWADGDEP
ncbi:FDXHR family putative zinc-binding protein [Mycobacterium sp.]|uniref:FDXHR family putative zinc-binding protein n=1 Tax=Mycobacterium sp. TaxID=1785 RepID=UPI003F997AE9